MMFERQTSRRLHDEHQATLALLGRFEQALLRARQAPDAGDQEWARQAGELATALEREVEQHFAFEEQSLFPRLHAAGESDIAMILGDEHEIIREAGNELVGLLRASRQQPLDASQWRGLKTLGLELVERMVAHVQKEEMALLPAIEFMIDDADDQALMLAYTAS